MSHSNSGRFGVMIISSLKSFLINWRQRPWLWGGAIGCGALLCIIILVLSSAFASNRIIRGDQSPGLTLPSNQAENTPSSNADTAVATADEVNKHDADNPQSTAGDEIAVEPNPAFGPICFKAEPDDSQLKSCRDTYLPVIEMHAIFDYSGMSAQNEWTRVWYHNGQEVLRVQENWTGDVEGQFDYNLHTSNGQPLSPGLWQLQLYVDGQLETFGSFVINNEVISTSVRPSASPPPTPTPTPIPTTAAYRLAFTKWDGGKHAIWVANLDGSEQQYLLDFAASPSWSPDGQSITFFGEEGIDTQAAVETGANGIWRMGANGENPTQLLPEGSAHSVAWSPIGDIIAFDAARGGPDRRVYFIGADGSVQNLETLGEQPTWSPDGQQVAVKVCRPECGLWIVNPNDSNPRQLTGEGSDGLPAWSPDGQKIAFSRDVDGNVDIFVIKVDGTDLQRLTTAPGHDSVPAWAPDGRQIAFRSARNGLWQIFLMNADGSNQRMIIDNVGASDEWAFDRMSIR